MKPIFIIKILLSTLIVLCCAGVLSACSLTATDTLEESERENVDSSTDSGSKTVMIVGDAVPNGEYTCDLSALYSANPYSAVYSTINNWPAKKAYAASGVLVSDILAAAGVTEYSGVNFASADGYNYTLTKEQLEATRYHYPGLLEGDSGNAEQVECIVALQFREDSWDIAEVCDENPCLIIGMSNFYEHTCPVFIENLFQLTVYTENLGQWESADTYPAPGEIKVGDTIKLQHDSFGLVKIYYTTDNSIPSVLSAMYNPSTYQPELNVPITADSHGELVIKTLVVGYGKADSEIGEYHFTVTE